MYLYFEEYHYPKEDFRKKELTADRLALVERGTKAKFQCVGYYYSTQRDDMVFILPKVFIVGGKAFGRYDPLEITHITKDNNPLKEHGDDQFVFGLSVWIYQAIQHFKARNEKTEIAESRMIQEPLSVHGEQMTTLLDTILKLLKFHKEHRYLFTYITIVNNSGNNKISWSKTISKVQPIIKGNRPYYVDFKNKAKTINFDEELIVLFYSVLGYLEDKYRFRAKSDLNYKLLSPSKVETMITTGRGTRRLKQIRRKYYTDELIALWKLIYVFFDQAEAIEAHKEHEEYLLAYNFERIFEDMIDQLIGSDWGTFPDEVKKQRDGKIVDHIYKDQSLINDEEIYFVGDSKFYKEDTALGKYSVYKQFTYAKNIIQYNMDVLLGEVKGEELHYRDELTEGYNITPNFFIRGTITPDAFSYSEMGLEAAKDGKEEIVIRNRHFDNRLFDRDTLILKAYNINFLYVLSSYVQNMNTAHDKERIRKRFRKDLVRTLNERYTFYKVRPKGSLEEYVGRHFREFIGKMYALDKEQLLMAFEGDAGKPLSQEDAEWQRIGLEE